MRTPRPLDRSARLVVASWLCAFAAGCGAERSVGDAQKYHPNGIGIEGESRNIPGKPKP